MSVCTETQNWVQGVVKSDSYQVACVFYVIFGGQ